MSIGKFSYFIFLLIYTALSAWCVRDTVTDFRKGNYWAFGLDITLIFVIWLHTAKLVFP